MTTRPRPAVNLCLFNNSPLGISDQVWFLKETLANQGMRTYVSDALRLDCLNLLIENFIETDAPMLSAFCRRHGKMLGIIMTEHIENEEAGLSVGGSSLHQREYIGNADERIYSLLSFADCTFCYLTLGDLPELRSWRSILPGHVVQRLPFPPLPTKTRPQSGDDFDVIFTGTATNHRRAVMKQLSSTYRLVHSELQEEGARIDLYARSRVAVNVPQDPAWRWVSPMRILFGLRHGTPTVHLGRLDNSAFSSIVAPEEALADAVANPGQLFENQAADYDAFVHSDGNPIFPAALFDGWAALELTR